MTQFLDSIGAKRVISNILLRIGTKLGYKRTTVKLTVNQSVNIPFKSVYGGDMTEIIFTCVGSSGSAAFSISGMSQFLREYEKVRFINASAVSIMSNFTVYKSPKKNGALTSTVFGLLQGTQMTLMRLGDDLIALTDMTVL